MGRSNAVFMLYHPLVWNAECRLGIGCHSTGIITGVLDHFSEVRTSRKTDICNAFPVLFQPSAFLFLSFCPPPLPPHHPVILCYLFCFALFFFCFALFLFCFEKVPSSLSLGYCVTCCSGQIVQGQAQQLAVRTTVAAHVAFSKEPVRLRDLATVRSTCELTLATGWSVCNCDRKQS